MSKQMVNCEVDARGVATITLNNPDRHNAFDDQVIAELNGYVAELHANEAVRVLILAASGKSFSAGADLDWMKRMATYSEAENLADAEKLADMFHHLDTLNKPTIARVQGTAFGGGVGLVSCCDIAIASTRASFCLSEVKLGLVPATISPYVVHAIGARAARRYFTTAERFSADTALRLGLVSEIVDEAALDETIDDLVANILCNGPNALAIAKQLVADVQYRPTDKPLRRQTSEIIAAARCTAEGREGVGAFLEKRSPAWANNGNSGA